MAGNSEVVICNAYILLFFDFGVSLNSGKYRPWMLDTTLFLCCSCTRPGTFFHLGHLRVTKRMDEFSFGGIYTVCLWEKVLCVSALNILKLALSYLRIEEKKSAFQRLRECKTVYYFMAFPNSLNFNNVTWAISSIN